MNQHRSPFVCQPQLVPDYHGVHVATAVIDGNTYGQPGKSADYLTVRRCIRAAIDGCTPCRDHYVAAIAADVLTLTYLIDFTCSEVGYALAHDGAWDDTGPLPASVTEVDRGSWSGPTFCRVAALWRRQRPDVGPRMYAELALHELDDRRRAALGAVDLLLDLALLKDANA